MLNTHTVLKAFGILNAAGTLWIGKASWETFIASKNALLFLFESNLNC